MGRLDTLRDEYYDVGEPPKEVMIWCEFWIVRVCWAFGIL